MRRFLPCCPSTLAAVVVVMLGSVVQAQAPLTLVTTNLPQAIAGNPVVLKFDTTGGTAPLTWKVTGGALPPGLKLDARSGVISGTPTLPGTYKFQIAVVDSGNPAMQVQREFSLVVTGAIGIEWKQAPEVHSHKLEGSVLVTNYTEDDFVLTVIVMAVNEIGRATALGYQEFTLKSGVKQVIPFGASPGPGKYIVHADAVAEAAKTNSIYRARQQTAEKLVIHGE